MGKRDPLTGKRVLKFVATSALVVAPVAFVACGGAKTPPEGGNVDQVPDEETMNVAEEAPEAPEATNVDHTAEEHSNVDEEAPPEGDVGGDEATPE